MAYGYTVWHGWSNVEINLKYVCVKGANGLTEYFLTLQGLQQGAILSPYLFAFYVNNLPGFLKAGNPNGGINIAGIDVLLLMYADDLVLGFE